MSREWRPGEVAVSMGDRLIRTSEGWWSSENGQSGIRYTTQEPRPLAVIDYEDPEQVERLLLGYIAEVNKCYGLGTTPRIELNAEAMQAALREFANPVVKPEEPTAMWSVVVDTADEHWVRVLGPDFPDGWVRAGSLPSNGKWTTYRDIDAVKVLRDGVQP